MNTNKNRIEAKFQEEHAFEVQARHQAQEQAQTQFSELKDRLVTHVMDGTQTLALRSMLAMTANEAAALAWTTPFPLLVFPGLFIEKVQALRKHAGRQQRIEAQTSELVEEGV